MVFVGPSAQKARRQSEGPTPTKINYQPPPPPSYLTFPHVVKDILGVFSIGVRITQLAFVNVFNGFHLHNGRIISSRVRRPPDPPTV